VSNNQISAALRQLAARQNKQQALLNDLLKSCLSAPPSITEEIDALPGRRAFYGLSDELTFVAADAGNRLNPMTFLVSQDGPFIMTHYPVIAWRPSAPASATNFGKWSSIYSWPLPSQDVANNDVIDISYEVSDTGSQRNFQNEVANPISSRFDGLIPLPVPTLFSPNTTIQITITLEDVAFNGSAATPATQGTIRATIPGFKVINL
jgi:hypothetical protein